MQANFNHSSSPPLNSSAIYVAWKSYDALSYHMSGSSAVISLIYNLNPKQTQPLCCSIARFAMHPFLPICLLFHTSLRKQDTESRGGKALEVCEQEDCELYFFMCAAAKPNFFVVGKCSLVQLSAIPSEI